MVHLSGFIISKHFPRGLPDILQLGGFLSHWWLHKNRGVPEFQHFFKLVDPGDKVEFLVCHVDDLPLQL